MKIATLFLAAAMAAAPILDAAPAAAAVVVGVHIGPGHYRHGGRYYRYRWHGGYYNYYHGGRYWNARYRCVRGHHRIWCYR